MAIAVQCPSCRAGYRLNDELAGRKVKCKKCGQDFRVSAAELDRRQGPQPSELPDVMPDLLPEAGIDGSGSPNVCPDCRTVMPPGAIVCINCGYNQKLGRKMGTEVVPAGSMAMDALPGAGPGGPKRKERALSLVATGMTLLYWAALLACTAPVVGCILYVGGVLPLPVVGVILRAMGLAIARAANLAVVVYILLQIVGLGLCLYVPRQSRAKGLILASVALELVAALVGSAWVVPGLPPHSHGVWLLWGLVFAPSLFSGFFVFLFSLKRLGRYLECPYLADEAQRQIIAFLPVVALLTILPVLALVLLITLDMGGLLLGFLLLFGTLPFLMIALIYLLIRYMRLLEAFREELLRPIDP